MIWRSWVQTPLRQFLTKFILCCVTSDLSDNLTEMCQTGLSWKTRMTHCRLSTIKFRQHFAKTLSNFCKCKVPFTLSDSVSERELCNFGLAMHTLAKSQCKRSSVKYLENSASFREEPQTQIFCIAIAIAQCKQNLRSKYEIVWD